MKQILSKYITFFLLICVLYLVGIPLLFQKAVPVICENLSYNSPYNIRVKKPILFTNIVPNAFIRAESVEIVSKDSEDKITVEGAKINLRLLPLLSGRIHINKMQADSIDLYAAISENPVLDKNFVAKALKTKVIFDCFKIKNFKIAIKEINQQEPAVYTGKDIHYRKNGRFLKLKAQTELKSENRDSKANINLYLPKNNNIKNTIIDVKLKNYDISYLGDFLKNYLPSDTEKIEGIIDLEVNKENLNSVLYNCAYIRKDNAKSIVFPDVIKINSGLNITRSSINLNNAEILAENINAVINGSVTNYMDKSLTDINLNLRINDSRIEDIIKMLPPFATEDINAYKLKKYKPTGNIIGNLNIKGDIKEPSVTGNMYVNNIILLRPIPNAPGAQVKLSFSGKYLNYDVFVPTGIYNGKTEKVNVKGGVELYNLKYADMKVTSTENVSLPIAQEKIIPIHEVLNFIIGPVPIMNISDGTGNIDITVKGNRKLPHVWGTLNFNDAAVCFNEMPDSILKNANLVMHFDDTKALFELKDGTVNGKKVSISGTGELNGKFDSDIIMQSQKTEDLYKSIKTSTIVNEIKNMLPPFDKLEGLANLKLKVYGHIKDINYVKYKENFFIKGMLELQNNTISAHNITIQNTNGNINFENSNADIKVNAKIGNSPLETEASLKNSNIDMKINIPHLNLSDVLNTEESKSKDISDIFLKVNAEYNGNINNIEYDKLNFSADITDVAKNNKLNVSNGHLTLKNGKLEATNIKGCFIDTGSKFNIDLKADKINTKPNFNGKVSLKDFELSTINNFVDYPFLPGNIKEFLSKLQFKKGKVNIDANIVNNNVNASTDIGGIELMYLPLELPLKVINGSVYIRKNYLGLNKININADDMPILIDGGINNIFSKRDFDLYINSKPKQSFIDKYVNNNLIYPLKVKGDILYWAKIKGIKDDFDIKSEADLAKDSSVYYLGATVGDVENAIILNLDMNVIKQKILQIYEFSYDKLIDSQNKRQTRLNMLKAFGGIDVEKEDLVFHNLKVKTSNPTDARIFNILFRKPNIKQGQFSSDLCFNGRLSAPHLIGTFHIAETNIPFLDTVMKNLSFDFKEKEIELQSSGEVLGNDIKFKGTLKNKLTPPYYIEKAELYTKILDLNYITDKLKSSQVNETNAFDSLNSFDIRNLIINNMKLTANSIHLRNLTAENVEASASLNDKKEFNISDFSFNIANGSLKGKFSYNLKDNKTNLNLKAKNINANDITIALFDINNQVYGDLTGDIILSCDGTDFNKCMQTLNGKTTFNVSDGRMPKLGSLEYLLRAGNIVKGGITGLSINSVVDILTPLKTGNFSNIYGTMAINDGIAKDIEITTKGKDLSLFMSGQYNFSTSTAEMEVLGLLSKKISTMFGPLGNISLNTVLNIIPGVDLAKDSKILDNINKIPGIELSGKSFRKFIAEINGDINSDNYVKSFKWIN